MYWALRASSQLTSLPRLVTSATQIGWRVREPGVGLEVVVDPEDDAADVVELEDDVLRAAAHLGGKTAVGDHHAATRAGVAIPLDLGHAFRPA